MGQTEICVSNFCSIQSGIVIFDSPGGKKTQSDLFDGRSHLIVYHFMVAPEWNEGCPSRSFVMDHTDGASVHLATRKGVLHPDLFAFHASFCSEAGLQHARCPAKPRGRHIVPMRLTNTPSWLYFRSVRSSEKSVKL